MIEFPILIYLKKKKKKNRIQIARDKQEFNNINIPLNYNINKCIRDGETFLTNDDTIYNTT